MEVVTMEKKAFDLMMARYDALVQKVELLKHKANGKRLNQWFTGPEVCQQLRISPAHYRNYATAVSWDIPNSVASSITNPTKSRPLSPLSPHQIGIAYPIATLYVMSQPSDIENQFGIA